MPPTIFDLRILTNHYLENQDRRRLSPAPWLLNLRTKNDRLLVAHESQHSCELIVTDAY
jgi:hypothetical protein